MSSLRSLSTAAPPRRARIEIIPLIDVIFFLLATFVLFTLSLNKISSLPVTLPAARADARPDADDPAVILQLSDHGTAFWNREPITLAELPARLRSYHATSSNPRILISGDHLARFGDAVAALDEVRLADIPVSIETTDRPSGR